MDADKVSQVPMPIHVRGGWLQEDEHICKVMSHLKDIDKKRPTNYFSTQYRDK